MFPIVTFPPVSVNVYVSVIPTFEKVSVTPSAIDIAALSVKVVPDIAATVVPAVTPVPETTCPTLINELPLSKVTDVELDTAPLTVSVTTSLVKVKSVNLFLIKLPVSVAAVPSVSVAVGIEVTSVMILPNPDQFAVAIPSISKSIETSFTTQPSIL